MSEFKVYMLIELPMPAGDGAHEDLPDPTFGENVPICTCDNLRNAEMIRSILSKHSFSDRVTFKIKGDPLLIEKA